MELRKYFRAAKLGLRRLQAFGIDAVQPEIVAIIPHDRNAFTQGVFLHEGKLYESAGLEGKSSLRVVEASTGAVERVVPVQDVFAEGIAMLDNRVYLLTWKSKVVLIYDYPDLALAGTLPYNRQGWGLTSDGSCLIVSNGSSVVEFRDAQFKLLNTVPITMNGVPLNLVNDMAYHRGRLYFNVYRHSRIYEADVETGRVIRLFDLEEIAKDELSNLAPIPFDLARDTVMLNGIAIDEQTGLACVTGKFWSRYYWFRVDP